MSASITYGDREISYQLVENETLQTKVRIHVHPNGAVEIEAPPNKTPGDITKALYKRASWISKKLDEAAAVREHVLPREYKSGETHFYLGRRYQLKVTETSDQASSVKLRGGLIHIVLPRTDRAAVRRRLNAWYKDHATEYFSRRVHELGQAIPWVNETPSIKLVKMRKQWGSCTPFGGVNLNPWLVRAPRECVDYVIVHELCHLKEHNHSKRFYALLDRHYPNWRHVKVQLDGMAELLLAD